MHHHRLLPVLLTAACLSAPWPAAHADTGEDITLDLSTGFNYSSGEYDDLSSTKVVIVPLSAKLKTGAWTFKASVPYVHIDGPADVVVLLDDDGGRGSDNGGSGRDHPEDDDEDDDGGVVDENRSVSGIGDTSLSATYSFDGIGGSATYIDITARARLSTGDEDKGLGLGTTDYGLSAELGYDGDKGGVYVLAGRRFLGSVDGLDREDGWLAGVGAWRNLGERTSIGAGYDWRESSLVGGRDPSEVYAYLNVKMSDAWRINLSASTGLNDANADYGVGLSLTWRALGD